MSILSITTESYETITGRCLNYSIETNKHKRQNEVHNDPNVMMNDQKNNPDDRTNDT